MDFGIWTIAPEGNCSPIRVWVRVRISFRLSGNCPRALDFVFLNQYYQITKKSVSKSQFYIHHASYLNFILEYSLWWIQQLYHVWENPFTGSLEIESHKTIGENVVRSFLNWSTKTFPSLLGDFTAAIFASIEWKWA